MAEMPMNQPTGHKGTVHAIIIMMLAALMAVETATLGYVVTRLGTTATPKVEILDGDDEPAAPAVPFVAFVRDGGSSLLVSIDRVTGAQTTLYNPPDVGALMTVYAVPQVGYSGKIYLRVQGEGDNPSLRVQEFDMTSKTLSPLSFLEDLPFVASGATALSPSQRTIAAVYSNKDYDSEDYMNKIVLWDLATGKSEVVGTIANNEYFSRSVGPNSFTFAGADGYDLSWVNDRCVKTAVYKDGADPAAGEKEFKEFKTYCSKQ